MRTPGKALKAACVGGIAFWLPDTIVHAIRRLSFSGRDVWFLTVAMPFAALAALIIWARVTGDRRSTTAVRMLFGVWLFGGAFMTLGATFSGGGFSSQGGLIGGLKMIALSLIPIYAFMMAMYDGSLFALLLITAVFFLTWALPKTKAGGATRHSVIYRD